MTSTTLRHELRTAATARRMANPAPPPPQPFPALAAQPIAGVWTHSMTQKYIFIYIIHISGPSNLALHSSVFNAVPPLPAHSMWIHLHNPVE